MKNADVTTVYPTSPVVPRDPRFVMRCLFGISVATVGLIVAGIAASQDVGKENWSTSRGISRLRHAPSGPQQIFTKQQMWPFR